jgi:hypothetical protein
VGNAHENVRRRVHVVRERDGDLFGESSAIFLFVIVAVIVVGVIARATTTDTAGGRRIVR